jgi:hypothetical protein
LILQPQQSQPQAAIMDPYSALFRGIPQMPWSLSPRVTALPGGSYLTWPTFAAALPPRNIEAQSLAMGQDASPSAQESTNTSLKTGSDEAKCG